MLRDPVDPSSLFPFASQDVRDELAEVEARLEDSKRGRLMLLADLDQARSDLEDARAQAERDRKTIAMLEVRERGGVC